MKIISFIEEREVIRRILRHCGLWKEPPEKVPKTNSQPEDAGPVYEKGMDCLRRIGAFFWAHCQGFVSVIPSFNISFCRSFQIYFFFKRGQTYLPKVFPLLDSPFPLAVLAELIRLRRIRTAARAVATRDIIQERPG